jgi:hypothetical protein
MLDDNADDDDDVNNNNSRLLQFQVNGQVANDRNSTTYI